MNYQEIFKIALLLISSPAKAWEEIRLQEDKRKVFVSFVYPLLGLCALSVFLGSLFTYGWGSPESYQKAMTKCCVVAVALFGGFFLAAYIINEVGTKVLKVDSDRDKVYQLSGYSLVVTFLTNIVSGIFPSFMFVGFVLQFYLIYIVWEGSSVLMDIREDIRLRYTLIVSALLILCPAAIQFVFNKLLYLLN